MENNYPFLLLVKESVCATYGCGIANACVVDVGHHKTAVCCVEDGFSHPDTRYNSVFCCKSRITKFSDVVKVVIGYKYFGVDVLNTNVVKLAACQT